MLDMSTSEVVQSNDTVFGASKEEYRRMKAWLDIRVEAGKQKPSAEVVTLTPLLARLLLGANKGNRPISMRNADDLASDIANKRWEFNGESIVVAKNGALIDGQHRCLQVVATGKSIETVIVFGPREEAKYTIDTGKSKTVSDFLAMKGCAYTHALGPAVNYVLQYRENGFITSRGSRNAVLPTKTQIVHAADELAGIDRSIEATAGCMKTIRSHSVLAFCHFIFARRAGVTTADDFMRQLIEGDDLKGGSPILYCRNRIYNFHRGVRPAERAEIVFKCWNAWRTGRTNVKFYYTGGKLPKVER